MYGKKYSTTRAAINNARRAGAVDAVRAAAAMNLSGSFPTSRGTRLRDRPHAPLATPNAHLDQYTRERLVRECGRLGRTNMIAQAFASRDAEIVAGSRPGLRLSSDDKAWNRDTAEWLEEWFTDGFDHEGVLSFGQFAGFAVENEHDQGDGLLVLLEDGSCQWIDGVRVRNPYNRPDTDTMVGGVALDESGRVVGYEVADWNAQGTMLSSATRRISAADAVYVGGSRGRKPGQRRAVPVLATVLDRIEDLDKLHTAVSKATELAALFSIFITSKHPEMGPVSYGGLDEHSEDGATIARAKADGELAVFPGSIQELEPGESIETTTPTQPSTQYEMKLWTDTRLIGARLGVPLELGFYKYDSNYAASRSAIVSAWKGVEKRQAWLEDCVITPIVRWRLAMAIRRGEIRRVDGWQKVGWNLPGIPTLDLGYEIDAVTRGIAGGVMTRADGVARINNGMTGEAFYAARAAELEREAEIGIQTQQPSAVTVSVNTDKTNEAGQQ